MSIETRVKYFMDALFTGRRLRAIPAIHDDGVALRSPFRNAQKSIRRPHCTPLEITFLSLGTLVPGEAAGPEADGVTRNAINLLMSFYFFTIACASLGSLPRTSG